MLGFDFSEIFGQKKAPKTVASITAVFTQTIAELNAHAENKGADIKEAENEIARQQEIAKAARKEAEDAKAVADKLREVFKVG